MLNRTTPHLTVDRFVHAMAEHMTTVAQQLSDWSSRELPDVHALEEQVLRTVKALGSLLVTGLCHLLVPRYPSPTHPCACGATAVFQRLRPATCCSVLGPITLHRPYYLCPTCHQGCAPLDHQLGVCAGSRSAGLDELLALLGAPQDSFAAAATVLERLTLVHVAPNTVRAATEPLGAVLAEVEQVQVTALQTGHPPAVTSPTPAGPLGVSLDGVQAHLTPDGWKELCVGAVYQVRPGCPPPGRRVDAVQAEAISSVAELGSRRDAFGWQLYAEAQRRGATTTEVAVLGDGAPWLWELAALHFPQATQILDWFHATEYIWSAATAIWGERHPERTNWAEQQLRALWAGQVATVLTALQAHLAVGEAVRVAQTYFTNQQARMDYPAYRARGLPIGSGTIESGCKQLVSARLKQAGMIWCAAGAQQVVKVRAWLKSGRWAEAMAVRPRRQRGYARRHGQMDDRGETAREGGAVLAACVEGAEHGGAARLSPDMVAAVQTALTHERTQHPWKRAWSRRQQRREMERHRSEPAVVSSA